MWRAARRPHTSPSSSDVLANRFAPCKSVQETSPTPYSRSTVERPPLVHPDTAAEIVGRRHHRHKVGADVQSIGQRPFPDRREVGENLFAVDIRTEVQKDICHAFGQHLAVNRAGDHVARRQIFPLRRMILHEWLTVPVNQPRPRPSHSLGDQKMNLALEIEGSRMKLNEFSVYHARTCATPSPNRLPRASWIGRPQIVLAQSTGCQHGKFGQSRFTCPLARSNRYAPTQDWRS